MVVYANGRCFGGAFRIAPGAALDSGVLECITVRDVAPLARVPLFARAIRGTHLSSPHVQVHRDGTFGLSFEAPPVFETDGELHRSATSEIAVHVRAGALTVVR
jgi:diacylglycerol kinase (ATP)